MPMANEQSVEVPADLRLRAMRLKRTPQDRSKRSNDAVAPLSAKTIAVSKQVSMAKDIERAIRCLRDAELDMLRSPEMPSDAAVDVPLVRGEHALLHLHLLGGAPMVANNTGHKQLAKA